ncbi:MAG: MopE-related protein [Myxococcaceae bacterium]
MRALPRQLPSLPLAALALALFAAGCNCGTPPVWEGDAGELDAGDDDAGLPDAGDDDAGLPDAGDDSGLPDAGDDAGLPDAGGDAGLPDAGSCVDADGDGYGVGSSCLGPDCDDANPAVHANGTLSCYTGPAGTGGVGVCRAGSAVCTNGVPGTCVGEVKPSAETCDGLDNDCNGPIDDGIPSVACYSGPVGTQGVGICHGGTSACVLGLTVCQGEQIPLPAEVCGNATDDNCNGANNESPCAQDTYVCDTCPGAADSNPGTEAQPVKTIKRGLAYAVALGKNKVFVANQSAAVAGKYTEDLTMADAIAVEGKWVAGATWARTSTVRTTLVNTTPSGVKFPVGLGRSAVLDGFSIESSGSVAGSTSCAAVTITSSSPTLKDVATVGSTALGLPVASSVGIEVTGSPLRRSNPRIEGLSTSSRSSLNGGGATTTSAGIHVTASSVDLQWVDASGGGVSGVGSSSAGVAMTDGLGTLIKDSTVRGGRAESCAGLIAQGNSGNVLLDNVTATGCPAPAGPIAAARNAVGVVFDNCPMLSGVGPPQVKNSNLTGGTVDGVGSVVAGASASDGCPLFLDSNTITGGVGSSGLGAVPELSVGVSCSYVGLKNPKGADSLCALSGNSIFGGFAQGTARMVGLSCEGSCATKDATCRGSCGEVSANNIVAPTGKALVHVAVSQSKPWLGRNRIGFGGNGVFCPANATVVGVALRGSDATLRNNLVMGGPCDYAVAMHVMNEVRTGDGSYPSPEVHSNTLVAGPLAVSISGVSAVGVVLETTAVSALPLKKGTFRNNIIVGGPHPVRAAFVERDVSSDPVELSNNLFWVIGGGGINPPLYLNENQPPPLGTAGAINALADTLSNANLSADPQFVNPAAQNYHIGGTSPARGMGTTVGMPTNDLDNQVRPQPAASNPDIGADEVP